MTKIKKTYDLVKEILQECPETRGDDKKMIIEFYRRQGIVESSMFVDGGEYISVRKFHDIATNTETIRRNRAHIHSDEKQKIRDGKLTYEQSLLPDKEILKLRAEIERDKGTHVFRSNSLITN